MIIVLVMLGLRLSFRHLVKHYDVDLYRRFSDKVSYVVVALCKVAEKLSRKYVVSIKRVLNTMYMFCDEDELNLVKQVFGEDKIKVIKCLLNI